MKPAAVLLAAAFLLFGVIAGAVLSISVDVGHIAAACKR